LFYLEFYGCFIYGICLDDQIDSYCANFIEFGDVWSHGVFDQEHDFHDFAFV